MHICHAAQKPFLIAVAGHVNKQLEDVFGDFGEMTKRLLAHEGEKVPVELTLNLAVHLQPHWQGALAAYPV